MPVELIAAAIVAAGYGLAEIGHRLTAAGRTVDDLTADVRHPAPHPSLVDADWPEEDR